MTLQQLRLTKEVIAKYVVRIEPEIKLTGLATRKYRQRNKELGLNSRGMNYRSRAHPDLAGLPLKEYKRIVAKRWRDAHPKGASSGKKLKGLLK